MKKVLVWGGMMIAVMMGSITTGCSSDDDNKGPEVVNIKPAKDPGFNVYSNRQVIDGSLSTRAVDVNGNLWYKNWQRPVNVTETEKAKVVAEFSKA